MFQLRLPWTTPRVVPPSRDRVIDVDGRPFPVVITRHRWARRYILRMQPDGQLKLTVPRGASIGGGLAFVARETDWIRREWARRESQTIWRPGSQVWYRGEPCTLERAEGRLSLGAERIKIDDRVDDLRQTVEAHLRAMAVHELPARCLELGRVHGLLPKKVMVRNQRSRWGSCASTGTITLNWRLVQMPPVVADYVICHELAHLDHPDHSRRFWRRVASLDPGWRDAERWLRRHGRELM